MSSKNIRVFLTLLLIHVALAGYKEIWVEAGKAAAEASSCKPFGIRLSWGRSIADPSSKEKLQVRFNTFKPCQTVSLLLDSTFVIVCPAAPKSNFMMMFDTLGQVFTSHVHICSLTSQIEYGKPFAYNIFDQGSLSTYMQEDITITLKDPNDAERPSKFIQFADWGKINRKNLPSLTQALKPILSQTQIDSLIINGDIAYDLNLQIDHHIAFMNMLEEVSKRVPVIFNRGNHEHGEAGTMFCSYFEVYGLCQRNATGLSIGSAFLSLFDPQAALIPRIFHLYAKEERLSSLTNLVLDLQRGTKTNRTVVAFSHYPLICSFPTRAHCIPNEYYKEILPLYVNLQEHFNTLLDFKVPLVFSGHVHTFQRSNKLMRGYRYERLGGNIIDFDRQKDEFLIQVVSGVAGSDTYMNEDLQYKEPKPFVSIASMKKVGFDIITVTRNNVRSEHIEISLDLQLSTKDDFTINFVQNSPLRGNDDL